MYQKILVPVDGSATSDLGLAEAVKLARLCGASVRVLHVMDELSLSMAIGDGMTFTPDLMGILKESGEALLRKAEATVRAAGVPVDSALSDNLQGRVCDVVVQEALACKADLIVVGTHGRRGAKRLFFGSDAEAILRHAPVPVLLVRAPDAPATA